MTSTNARLVITDGTAENTATLLVELSGANLLDWFPKAPPAASSVWSSSPYQDGKHLINKTYDNIIDTFTVAISTNTANNTIHKLRRFIVLLEKAILYWTDEFNTHKYWLEARSECETNIRYAMAVDYSIPEINNPFEKPFEGEKSTLDEIQISIEHTIWTDELVVGDSCVEKSSGTDALAINFQNFEPQVSLDDAYVWNGAFTGNAYVVVGVAFAASFTSGIRFRNITIPANATISRAWIEFEATNVDILACSGSIWIEDDVAPAIFSNFANFIGRTMMPIGIGWPNIVNTVPNQKVDTPDISFLINYIVNKAGWAAGNDLAIFITDDASVGAREFGSMDTGGLHPPILHIEYVLTNPIVAGVFRPTISEDDAWTSPPAAIDLNSVDLRFGNTAGDNIDTGIRFRTVTIPPGAQIVSAYIRFKAHDNCATDDCHIILQVEDDAHPATFSTYADFHGRVIGAPTVNWFSIPHWTIGDYFDTANIAPLIQAAVNKVGWASGHDIVIFVLNNGSDANAMRLATSWDDADPPTLQVQWIDVLGTMTLGESPTCLLAPVIQPLYRDTNLVYAFNYEDATGIFSANLVTSGALEEEHLFPAVPAVGDCLYVCINHPHDHDKFSPFNSLVIHLASLGVDITGVDSEYWDGGGYAALVNQVEEPNPFWDAAATLGMHYLMWEYPDDWVENNVNTIDGMWVRFIITAVGGAPVAPERDPLRALYTISWPYIQVAGTELQGDINTLINFLLSNRSAAIDRIMISARKYSRTNTGRFSAYIPCNTHVYLPDAVFTPNPATVSEAQSSTAYSGWLMTWVPGAGPVTHVLANFDLNPKTYAGRFRAFIRAYTYNPTDIGNISLYLLVQLGGGGYYTTPAVFNAADHDNGEVLDLGLIAFPPEPNEETVTTVHPWTISLVATNTVATDVLAVFDLILMPVDEAHIEIEMNSALSHYRNTFYYPWKIVTTNFKLGAYGFTLLNYTPMVVDWNDEIVERLKINILGAFDIEPEEDYWLIFLAYESQSADNLGGLHLFEHLIAPNLDKNQRFLLARGDE